MKQQAGKINIRTLFIIVQIILYLSFLCIDLTDGSLALSSYIKFTVIILCFCYVLFSEGDDKSISFCLKIAMLFTLISDLLILILDYYFYGVLTFIVVQQMYSFRLSLKKHGSDNLLWKQIIVKYTEWLAVQMFLAVIVLSALYLSGIVPDQLLIASAFYFICILTNTIRADIAAIAGPKENGSPFFAVGMTLFLLCDINVGLFNLSGFLSIPKEVYSVIYQLSSILMWTFYAPAQVLISLSIYTKKQKKFM